MGGSWSSVCQSAYSRSLQVSLDINKGFCGALIVGFCITAVYSGRMFIRYIHFGAKENVWRHYGAFTALVCCGCILGAVAWSARMQELYYLYVSEDDYSKENFAGFLSGQSQKYYWKAVFGVFYPLEFAFLSIAKLTVLDRLFSFAAPPSTIAKLSDIRKRLSRVLRCIMVAAVAGSAIGFCGNVASAVYCVQIGRDTEVLLQLHAANISAPWRNFPPSIKIVDTLKLNATALSIQLFCELIVLILVVVVFVVFGVICLRRIYAARSQLVASNESSHVQLHKVAQSLSFRIVTTVLAITVAFSLRSVFAIIYALASTLPNIKNCSACGGSNCNEYDDMKRYLLRSPEFQTAVIFIASPVTLAIAVWGMTTNPMINSSTMSSPSLL